MPLRIRFTILPLLAVTVIALSATFLIAVQPLLAQTTTLPTCATGTAVPNPGLVADCEALLEAQDT